MGADAEAPAPVRTTRKGAAERTRLPGSAYALRGTMVFQGAVFGASQAGITALTEELGAPAQAGLVYAAMGVMSAAVGLSMAAVPARIGLTPLRAARRRPGRLRRLRGGGGGGRGLRGALLVRAGHGPARALRPAGAERSG
ncbi:hypothetical protein [Streptomyces sp. NPDC002825]|uniref:hypothetical protein n=1 Tax=Streptomyces sp. NPDC002825 TaxID=3154666 RepID=UPI00331DE2F8